MFVLCPHCQFLVAVDPASGLPPAHCPRCNGAVLVEPEAAANPRSRSLPATCAEAEVMPADGHASRDRSPADVEAGRRRTAGGARHPVDGRPRRMPAKRRPPNRWPRRHRSDAVDDARSHRPGAGVRVETAQGRTELPRPHARVVHRARAVAAGAGRARPPSPRCRRAGVAALRGRPRAARAPTRVAAGDVDARAARCVATLPPWREPRHSRCSIATCGRDPGTPGVLHVTAQLPQRRALGATLAAVVADAVGCRRPHRRRARVHAARISRRTSAHTATDSPAARARASRWTSSNPRRASSHSPSNSADALIAMHRWRPRGSALDSHRARPSRALDSPPPSAIRRAFMSGDTA